MNQIIKKISDSYEKLIIENYEEDEYTKKYRKLLASDSVNLHQFNNLSYMMSNLHITEKEKNNNDKDKIEIFNGTQIPDITILDYLTRIVAYSKCSNECYISSYIHLKRLLVKGTLKLTRLNIHRLLLISIMVFSKFYDDDFYSNKHWGLVGGVNILELNKMEWVYLELIDYDVNVSTVEFVFYSNLFSVP